MTSAQHDRQVTIFHPRHTEFPVSTGSAVQLDRARRPVPRNRQAQRGGTRWPRCRADCCTWSSIVSSLRGPCAMSTHP